MLIKWIPEDSKRLGYYAMASLNSNKKITRNIYMAPNFDTESECQAWINSWELKFGMPLNQFKLTEHSFHKERDNA